MPVVTFISGKRWGGSRPTYETSRSRSDFQEERGEVIILKQNEYVKNVSYVCLVSVALYRPYAPANFVDSCPRRSMTPPDDFVWFSHAGYASYSFARKI